MAHPTVIVHHHLRSSDAGAHGTVDAAAFSTLLEQARYEWFERTGAADEPSPLDHGVDVVLARTELTVHAQVHHPATLDVEVAPGRIGTKSCSLGYRIRNGEQLVAEGSAVLVGYDYARRRSAPLPAHWRRRLEGVTG